MTQNVGVSISAQQVSMLRLVDPVPHMPTKMHQHLRPDQLLLFRAVLMMMTHQRWHQRR
jgi:hypothetical protein